MDALTCRQVGNYFFKEGQYIHIKILLLINWHNHKELY